MGKLSDKPVTTLYLKSSMLTGCAFDAEGAGDSADDGPGVLPEVDSEVGDLCAPAPAVGVGFGGTFISFSSSSSVPSGVVTSEKTSNNSVWSLKMT